MFICFIDSQKCIAAIAAKVARIAEKFSQRILKVKK
jgi:hypothetical protein